MRFLKQIYKSCRDQVGNDYPIFIKMSAYDNMKNGVKDKEMKITFLYQEHSFIIQDSPIKLMKVMWNLQNAYIAIFVYLGLFHHH